MTDTRFSLQLDEVAVTVSRLSVLEQHLAHSTKDLRRQAQQGCGDVASGVDAFAAHWKTGLDNVHKTVHELHDSLSVAHEGYAQQEQGLSDLFSGHGG